MNKTILFSPIGGTDPISLVNWRDGSMLHIARVYKPERVYLYMSAEILQLHRQDNRYLYCLNKLAQKQNRAMDCRIIERDELKKVQLFDWFYEDFRQIIKDIAKDADESDTILLNISSGTPAMKSALLVLTTLGEYPCRLIQVATPTEKMNKHDIEGYDVKSLWEVNEDNADNFVNRCQEVACPSLSQIKQEEMIKKLVRAYDYTAAQEIAAALPPKSTASYLPLIDLACARMLLDLPRVNSIDKETGKNCIPIKTSNKQKYFEYALNMDVKRKKKEYTDFIRSVTPLIVDLFTLILKHTCDIDTAKCTEGRPLKWNKEQLKENYPEADELLNSAFNGNFNYREVYSSALVIIIKGFSKDKTLTELAENLRSVEEKARNRAAHEIVSLSDETIKNMTGFDTENIMKMLKSAFKYTDIGVSSKYWDSYEDMNEKIIAAMP